MRTILVFKETLLPMSETFVQAQAGAMTRYTPRLTGLEATRPSLPLPPGALLLSGRPGRLASLRAKLYRRWPVAPRFHSRAQRARPALIHAHFASGGRTALALARRLHLPLIVTLHGSDVTLNEHEPEAFRRLGREAALFLCVSEFIYERALTLGLPAEKLLVHSIGIDRSLFHPAVASPTQTAAATGRILFVGRLVEKKGCEYLLRAMPRVQSEYPDATLTVIGDGPLRPSLESLARQLGVGCEFRGAQPAGAVRAELAQARIFCAPSVQARNGDSEGLGMVFAEAQAMGVPVVSSDHAGVREIIRHGVTGLLAPERDPQALAETILGLMRDQALWSRLRQAAIAHVESRFDLHKQTELLEHIYDNVLATSRVPGRLPLSRPEAGAGAA